MRYKWRLAIGGTIALGLIAGIIIGYDGALKVTLGTLIGYLFGTASKETH